MTPRDLAAEAQPPTEDDVARARQVLQALTAGPSGELTILLGDGKEITLPRTATPLIADLLAEIAQGHAVSIVPLHDDLTTQEAADRLNVSYTYLVGLLENGAIPYHEVGTHRRIRPEDLSAFKAASDARRDRAMDELAAQAQAEGMGY